MIEIGCVNARLHCAHIYNVKLVKGEHMNIYSDQTLMIIKSADIENEERSKLFVNTCTILEGELFITCLSS